MNNRDFIAFLEDTYPDHKLLHEHAKKLIAVAKEAKDYVEGRAVEFGTLELEDALEYLERE